MPPDADPAADPSANGPPSHGAFVDTNVLVYLFDGAEGKAERAERVLEPGTVTSVQVLNELTNIARRKLHLGWDEIDEIVSTLGALLDVRPLTRETHDDGRRLARRYGFAVYDAMIVASALAAACPVLLTEDMHGGLVVDDSLTLVDPFV